MAAIDDVPPLSVPAPPPARTPGLSFTGLAAAFDRLLPFWFLLWTAIRLGALQGFSGLQATPGLDFRIYRAGAVALLEGRDPWTAVIVAGRELHFAALPTAAQIMVPFALIPETIGLALFLGASVTVAVLALRRLGLPLWWLLFPPLVEGLLAANPQVLLFGLLVLGATGAPGARGIAMPIARTLAVALKVYAIAPIVARAEWRAVAAVAGLFAASFVLAPGLWFAYLEQFGAIAARLLQEAHGGLSAAALLVPTSALGAPFAGAPVIGLVLAGAVAGLVLLVAWRDVRAAGWLAVPMLWPASEYHYALFAVPVARRAGIWIIAMGMPWASLIGLIVLAVEILLRRRPMVRDDGTHVVGLREWLAALPLVERLRRRRAAVGRW